MPDPVKIYGRDQERDGREEKPGANLARFRRGRRAGDTVQGLFLRLEATRPGTAWINFEGVPLLAALPDELLQPALEALQGMGASAPRESAAETFPLRPGDRCLFRLETLDPEPVLRMLRTDEPSGRVSLRV